MSNKTPEQISYNMSQIKNKGSKIEVMLCKELWNRGIRYRKNAKSVFGCPDLAFKRNKVSVFCDSEFWHGYDWENRKKDFKSHQEFWILKIERNIQRDKEVTEQLTNQGWTVIRFWGKEIKQDVSKCADIIQKAIGR
ncbi:MAG: very short patch repair endonuclease [Oscillospiraceae bacterium]